MHGWTDSRNIRADVRERIRLAEEKASSRKRKIGGVKLGASACAVNSDSWTMEEGSGLWCGIIHVEPMGAVRLSNRDKFKPTDAAKRYYAYKDRVRAKAPAFVAPYQVEVTAHIAMPSSWSKKKKALMCGKRHQVRPDRDNIGKGVQDALFDEDGMISDGTDRKRWAYEGLLEIKIWIGCAI